MADFHCGEARVEATLVGSEIVEFDFSEEGLLWTVTYPIVLYGWKCGGLHPLLSPVFHSLSFSIFHNNFLHFPPLSLYLHFPLFCSLSVSHPTHTREKTRRKMAAAYYREPMKESERAPVSPQQPHSPWHSPVPYLFGGLAAMLGLIAFALLILACSYWKLSGYLEDNNGEAERDLESGEAKNDENQKPQKPYEEKILVIMAGQEKPTFLATPVSSSTSTSRSSSFGDNTSTCTCDQSERKSVEMEDEAVKQGSGDWNRETSSDQNH